MRKSIHPVPQAAAETVSGHSSLQTVSRGQRRPRTLSRTRFRRASARLGRRRCRFLARLHRTDLPRSIHRTPTARTRWKWKVSLPRRLLPTQRAGHLPALCRTHRHKRTRTRLAGFAATAAHLARRMLRGQAPPRAFCSTPRRAKPLRRGRAARRCSAGSLTQTFCAAARPAAALPSRRRRAGACGRALRPERRRQPTALAPPALLTRVEARRPFPARCPLSLQRPAASRRRQSRGARLHGAPSPARARRPFHRRSSAGSPCLQSQLSWQSCLARRMAPPRSTHAPWGCRARRP